MVKTSTTSYNLRWLQALERSIGFNKYQTALDKIKEATLPLKKNSYEIIKGKLK
jgi:hypothetical protein